MAASQDKICLVEDDPTIRSLLRERLERAGWEVSAHETGEAALDAPAADLYILDVLLPGEISGLQVCERVRTRSPRVPILILSALAEPADRIEGLRLGADDYLAKPFEVEELLLRVRGMLRRRQWYEQLPEGGTFEWADNSIDFVSYEGRSGNRRFRLGQKECMLMKLLIERRNQVVTRSEILDRVWGYDAFPSTRTVDNFIVRLRKRFERTPGEPRHIHSVRGVGYKFTVEETP